MDYSGYHEFPFPAQLSEEGKRARDFFLKLSDDEQLRLLNGCASYEEFWARLQSRRKNCSSRLNY